MLSSLHTAVLHVQDFAAAVESYSTLLGRSPVWIGVNRQRSSRSAFFAVGNTALEICDPGTKEATPEGLVGIRLGIEPGDSQFVKTLGERGVSILEATRETFEDVRDGQLRHWVRHPIDPSASRQLTVELVSDASDGLREEPDSSIAVAAVAALDHVVVFSAAPDATRDFYGEGLGIRLALDRTFEERKVRLLFFRLGGVTIEIGSRVGASVDPDAADRFGGLAWQVVDVERIRERLLSASFDVSETRPGNKAGTRVCTVRSPVCGVPTLLIQPVSR